MLEQPVPEGLQDVGRTHTGAVCEELQPVGKDSRWRSLWRTVSRGRDLMLEQGRSVSSPCPEEEGAAQTMSNGLIATPIPVPLCLSGGGDGENRE